MRAFREPGAKLNTMLKVRCLYCRKGAYHILRSGLSQKLVLGTFLSEGNLP